MKSYLEEYVEEGTYLNIERDITEEDICESVLYHNVTMSGAVALELFLYGG